LRDPDRSQWRRGTAASHRWGAERGVVGAVFVDAILPHPGESWFATVPAERAELLRSLAVDNRLPPWHRWFPPESVQALLPDEQTRSRFVAEIRELPLAYFDEPAPMVAGWPPPRCGYVQLSGAYEREATEAERRGWMTVRESADHLAVLTQPARVGGLLDGMVRAMLTTESSEAPTPP
jgi:hypothetical protein